MITIPQTTRVQSLDVLRALTMALMIFVNDIPGLGDSIPHWLHHAAYDEDMLGLSDIVFPLFLFCVGLSIPFAFQKRLERGQTRIACFGHVVERTIALLIMGLFASNGYGQTAAELGLSPHLLKILTVVAYFLIWNDYRPDSRVRVVSLLKGLGWSILGLLALLYVRQPGSDDWVVNWGWLSFSMPSEGRYLFQFVIIVLLCAAGHWSRRSRWIVAVLLYLFLFKGADSAGMVGLRPGWWQILGLIGWTYLLTASCYLWIGPKVGWMLGLAGIALFYSILSVMGWLGPLKNYIPGNGAFHVLSFAGVAAGLWLRKYGMPQAYGQLSRRLWLAAAVSAIGGWLAHQCWIVSKLQETAPWVLYCLAISFSLLALLHYWTDIQGKAAWFACLRPAGVATLTCYLLPNVWYALVSWLGIKYPAWATVGIGGIFRALLFTAVIIAATALLGKFKIRLKI